MNMTQIQALLAPLIAAAAAWLASQFPLLDQATWNNLVSTIAFAIVAGFLTYMTRKKSLANSLGKIGDTTVVTDKKTADALPNNNAVVANTDVRVVKASVSQNS